MEKQFDVTKASDIKSDVKFFGDPDAWVLLGKASVENKWMKSTKAIDLPGGCLVQTTSEHKDNKGDIVACSDALQFVPDVSINKLKEIFEEKESSIEEYFGCVHAITIGDDVPDVPTAESLNGMKLINLSPPWRQGDIIEAIKNLKPNQSCWTSDIIKKGEKIYFQRTIQFGKHPDSK